MPRIVLIQSLLELGIESTLSEVFYLQFLMLILHRFGNFLHGPTDFGHSNLAMILERRVSNIEGERTHH
jgi:hypothetical protein